MLCQFVSTIMLVSVCVMCLACVSLWHVSFKCQFESCVMPVSVCVMCDSCVCWRHLPCMCHACDMCHDCVSLHHVLCLSLFVSSVLLSHESCLCLFVSCAIPLPASVMWLACVSLHHVYINLFACKRCANLGMFESLFHHQQNGEAEIVESSEKFDNPFQFFSNLSIFFIY